MKLYMIKIWLCYRVHQSTKTYFGNIPKSYYQLFFTERHKILLQDKTSTYLNCTFAKQMNNQIKGLNRFSLQEDQSPQSFRNLRNPSNSSNSITVIHNLMNPSNNSDSKKINNICFLVNKI